MGPDGRRRGAPLQGGVKGLPLPRVARRERVLHPFCVPIWARPWHPLSRQTWFGTALLTASAIAYSTAGFFTRLIDLDAWTILFWRGLFAGLFLAGVIAWQERRRLGEAIRAIGIEGLLVALGSALRHRVLPECDAPHQRGRRHGDRRHGTFPHRGDRLAPDRRARGPHNADGQPDGPARRGGDGGRRPARRSPAGRSFGLRHDRPDGAGDRADPAQARRQHAAGPCLPLDLPLRGDRPALGAAAGGRRSRSFPSGVVRVDAVRPRPSAAHARHAPGVGAASGTDQCTGHAAGAAVGLAGVRRECRPGRRLSAA